MPTEPRPRALKQPSPTDRPPDAAATAALYAAEVTRHTHERFSELARLMLASGSSVVIDAACNRRQERRILAAAACERAVRLKLPGTQ